MIRGRIKGGGKWMRNRRKIMKIGDERVRKIVEGKGKRRVRG